MSSAKTEKPTPKKIRDASRKGQTFKARDLVIALMLMCACAYLTFSLSLEPIHALFVTLIAHKFNLPIPQYVDAVAWIFFKLSMPLLVLCIVLSALPSLIITKFALATEAIKFDLSSLNPINGFKKIFSLRTVKEAVKAVLYLLIFTVAVYVFWKNNKKLIFVPLNGQLLDLVYIWPRLFFSLVMTCLCACLIIFILDTLSEFFLHLKSLKMDKQEVKQEHKEQEGNHEVKSRRREIHIEIISEQIKNDVAQSSFIVANPTHIAVGVYFNPEIATIPYISVVETEMRALAVIAYAEKMGVPVVRDQPLARRLYKTVRRYSFVPLKEFHNVMRILMWLQDVETAARDQGSEVRDQESADDSH